MKRIKKTLMAGVLACSALQARAEVSQWGLHVKGGLSLAWLWGEDMDKVKVDNKAVEGPKFFNNPFLTAGLYGECAFNNYIGMELGANYLRLGSVLKGPDASGTSSTSAASTTTTAPCCLRIQRHALSVPVSLCIYPLGREEDELILKLFVGPSFNIILKDNIAKRDEGKDAEDEIANIRTMPLDIAGKIGIGLEFPIGLSLEARYEFGGLDLLKGDDVSKKENQTTFAASKVTDVKNMKGHHATLTVGYNVLNLFSE